MNDILRYLTGPDDPEALDQAVDALRAGRQVTHLKSVLAGPLDCETCRARLPEYAAAVELDVPLTPDLEMVKRHLAHCTGCSAEFVELEALSRLGEEVPRSEEIVPAPDLGFLQTPAASLAAGLWRQVEAGRHEVIAEFQAFVSGMTAWFGALPGGLTAQPLPAPILRDDTVPAPAQRLRLPNSTGEFVFEVTLRTSAGGVHLEFGVFQTVGQRPVERVTVILSNELGQRLQRADTGADGRVTFADLPLGHYQLQLRMPDARWELRLVVSAAGG